MTVGTPHQGSPLANLLLYQQMGGDCPKDEDSVKGGIQNENIDEARRNLSWKGNESDGGAVTDLAEGSPLLQLISSKSQEVPTYALGGNIGQKIDLQEGGLDWLVTKNIGEANCEYQEIFGKIDSDGIVPVPSAEGRVTKNQVFPGIMHTGLMKSEAIGQRVVNLLNGSVADFATFAFVPSTEPSAKFATTTGAKDLATRTSWRLLSLSMRDLFGPSFLATLGISDARGQTLPAILLSANKMAPRPGDTIVFSAQVSDTPESPVFLSDSKDRSWEDSTMPYQWSVTLPQSAAGLITYKALAEFDGKTVASNSVGVVVTPDMAGLTQLSFYPQRPLVMFVGDKEQLRVEGRFRDGYVRHLTEKAIGTTFRERAVAGLEVLESDSPFISVADNGTVTALAAGEAEVVAENNGVVTERRISVRKWDSVVIPARGDVDDDGDVDRDDLLKIVAARNVPATGPDDPRDIDSDGMITALDARKFVLQCTRPRCATE